MGAIFLLRFLQERGDFMAWIEYNPNPRRNRVGDCAIRAVAKATDQDWEMA